MSENFSSVENSQLYYINEETEKLKNLTDTYIKEKNFCNLVSYESAIFLFKNSLNFDLKYYVDKGYITKPNKFYKRGRNALFNFVYSKNYIYTVYLILHSFIYKTRLENTNRKDLGAKCNLFFTNSSVYIENKNSINFITNKIGFLFSTFIAYNKGLPSVKLNNIDKKILYLKKEKNIVIKDYINTVFGLENIAQELNVNVSYLVMLIKENILKIEKEFIGDKYTMYCLSRRLIPNYKNKIIKYKNDKNLKNKVSCNENTVVNVDGISDINDSIYGFSNIARVLNITTSTLLILLKNDLLSSVETVVDEEKNKVFVLKRSLIPLTKTELKKYIREEIRKVQKEVSE